jgi:hypothetical protein
MVGAGYSVTGTSADSRMPFDASAGASWSIAMRAVFIESPAFERSRETYLDDDSFSRLQGALMANAEAGEVIQGTGGLRKLRFDDERRSEGKRGGLRVIYYYWTGGPEYWLFTLCDKDEVSDLTGRAKPNAQAALLIRLVQRYPDTLRRRLAEI